MNPALNPFTPGSGLSPPVLADRDVVQQDFQLVVTRSKRRIYDRGTMMIGLRGVGKTALLHSLARHADSKGWLTIRFDPGADTEIAADRVRFGDELVLGLGRYRDTHRAKRAIDGLIEMAENFALGGASAQAMSTLRRPAPTGTLGVDLEKFVEAVSVVMATRGSAFGLFIDEMHDLDRDLMKALLAAQHRASRRNLPFFIFGAGLPTLPAVLAENHAYAVSLFSYAMLEPLPASAAADALRCPVERNGASFTADALATLVAASGGYPYFVQEFGKAIWNTAPHTPFTVDDALRAVEQGRQALDAEFFPTYLNRISHRERRYLRAMTTVEGEEPRSGDVARALGVSTTTASATRQSLINKNIIWSPGYGRLAVTIPGMIEYFQRTPTK